MSTHAVYWLDINGIPQVEFFTDLTVMLNFSLEKHNDSNCRFITTASEIDDCVSLQGVSAPKADYDWKKRRNR